MEHPKLVKFCYRLEASTTYQQHKAFFHQLLENSKSPMRPWFDGFMVFLILISVSILLYSVKNDIGLIGESIEIFAVSIFTIEYLLRFWLFSDTHKIILKHYERLQKINRPFYLYPPFKEILIGKWHYISSPMAIVDLLSILPSYRPLRIFRIFLLFRLFKLFRYTRSIQLFATVINEKKNELKTLLVILSFVIFTAAAAFYIFENKSDGGQIEHFSESIYWALVTLSTVGYGDITPHTYEGQVIASILIVSGVAVVSFFTSIIVSAFNDRIKDVQQQRLLNQLKRHKSHIIICGYGRTGKIIAKQLNDNKKSFIIVDPCQKAIEEAQKDGYLTILGKAENIQLQKQIGIHHHTSHFICLGNDDVSNVYAVLNARHQNPDLIIIARANHLKNVRKLKQAGANYVIQTANIISGLSKSFINQPVGFEAIQQILNGQHDIGLDTISVQKRSKINGLEVGSVNFKDYALILVGIISAEIQVDQHKNQYHLSNGYFYFNPSADFLINRDDWLVVMGNQFGIQHFTGYIND